MMRGRSWCALLLLALLYPGLSHAQSGLDASQHRNRVPVIDGPAAPVAPEVIARDDRGRVTVRAVRLTGSFQMDGRLDEAIYAAVPPFSGFIQNLPNPGKPSTLNTEVWVLFDAENVYVSARCWDDAPESAWIVNEMRRDAGQISNNENFGVLFDTFYDRRNGVMLFTTPLGAQRDLEMTNEGNSNQDWNPVWDVRSGRFKGGWSVEMKIPFKSLRYRPGQSQVWGVQFRRGIRHLNEWAYLTALPATAGAGAWTRMSMAATLVGLEVPSGSKHLEIKPYAIGGVRSDRATSVDNDGTGDAGFDVKYGLTQNLTVDFTYNTDFAQVEADEQQVNLTRFNLFFPEKREFFLEGRGLFEFGRPNLTRGSVPTGGIVPDLFFSRQIGLVKGRVVPVNVGARMTGKIHNTSIGLLSIQTEQEPIAGTPTTSFNVARLRQDVLKRSSIGVMATVRSQSLMSPGGSNQAYGADAAFSFFESLNFNGYYARTETSGDGGDGSSYLARVDYDADRYGLELSHLLVSKAFNPEIGYVQRPDIRRTYGVARFSPRPKSIHSVRQFSLEGAAEYLEDTGGELVTHEEALTFSTEFQRSDRATFSATHTYDVLADPFRLPGGPVIAPGTYGNNDVAGGYSFGTQRKISGTVRVTRGTFYGGDHTVLTISGARVQLTPQFSLEPSTAINWFDLPAGAFSTRVVRGRLTYTFTPRMFVSGLLQYNSSSATFTSNVRWRWEYSPGSEIFVVYSDDRDTAMTPDRRTNLIGRSLVVKINRLLRL